jgi:hypothetical protein
MPLLERGERTNLVCSRARLDAGEAGVVHAAEAVSHDAAAPKV